MEKLPRYHGWSACRSRRAIIVFVTALSFARGEVSDVRAAWISLPFSQRSENPASRQPGGYPAIIRRLLEDAKALEEEGKLDRAIVLAQRAHRLSLSSTSIRKQDADLAPELLAKYASELRLKKVEHGVQRLSATTSIRSQRLAKDSPSQTKDLQPLAIESQPPVIEPLPPAIEPQFQANEPQNRSVDSDQSTSDFLSALAANSIPPAPSSVTVPRSITKSADARFAARATPSPPVALSNGIQIGTPVQPVSSITRGSKQATVTVEFDNNEKSASSQSRTSQLADSDDNFNPFEPSEVSKPAEQTPSEKWDAVVATNESDERSVDGTVNNDQSTTSEESSTTIVEEEIQEVSKTKQIKLRPRFDTDEPMFVQLPGDSDARSKLGEPTITPKSTEPFERKIRQEPGRIVDDVLETESESPTAPAKQEESDRLSDELKNKFEQLAEEVPISDFPRAKVIALKQKLDSAISLNPGEIAGGSTTEFMANSMGGQTTEENKIENRRIRFRKHQRVKSDIHSNLAEQIGQGTRRQPVIGEASIIQWRTVKDGEQAVVPAEKFETKSARLIQDLRETLRVASSSNREVNPNPKEPSQFSLGKSEVARTVSADRQRRAEQAANSSNPHNSTKRTSIRGSLWDNASAPSDTGSSGTIGGSGKLMNSQSVELGYAPKPPSDSMVEQISFDKPAELFSRRTSAKEPSDADADEEDQQSFLPADRSQSGEDNGSADEHSSATRSIFAYGPFEWPSLVFGTSKSTSSSIFGAAGVALFFVGLWVARETIRSKNS